MTTITLPRAVVEQALEAMRRAVPTGKITLYEWDKAVSDLSAALAQQAEPVKPVAWLPQSELDDLMTCNHRRLSADSPTIWAPYDISSPSPDMGLVPVYATPPQQAEPVPGKVVAWGIFALTDGEWQLQHPVFVGDECGKENAEFERASYSGPQPLEVRPLGVVTAAAQQAEPVQESSAYSKDWCLRMAQIEMDAGAEFEIGPDLAQQAEPVEPVAWVRLEAWKSGQSWPDDCFTALPAEGLTPLYTVPPKRKPLTDEEIAAEWQKASECAGKSEAAVTASQFVQMFARAIERAHGVKE